MAEAEPPLTDAEIAAFMRRLVRQIMREEAPRSSRPKSAAPTPVLLPRQVAQRWGCSERTVRNMIKDGRLPGLRIGEKLLRVRLEDVEHYEREMEQEDPVAPPSISAPASTGRYPLTRLRLAELRRRGQDDT